MKKKKQYEDKTIEKIRIFFLNKKIRDINNLFKQEEDYYKPVSTGNVYSNNCIKDESDRNKTLSIKEYIDKIGPCLKDINNLKKSDTWKIQLTIAVNFISLKDTDEESVMHSKSDNIEIMIYDKADEVTEELFELTLSRDQIGVETSMKGSEFYL